MTRLESRSLACSLAALAVVTAVAACDQGGPTQQPTPASPALAGASPRKHVTVYEPYVQIISRIPVKVSRDARGTCKWGETANPLNEYIRTHPEKVPGRSASLSDYDEDTCEGMITVKIDRPDRQPPMRAETTTVRYPKGIGLSTLSPNRLNSGDVQALNEPLPPEASCYVLLSQGSNTVTFNTKQDLRIDRTGSVRMATQLTAWARYLSYTNPSSMACVKIDSSRVIRSYLGYYSPTANGETQVWDPAPTSFGEGWAWCSNQTTNGCLVEAFAATFATFQRGCPAPAPEYQYFFFGSPILREFYDGYYGRVKTNGIGQVAGWGSPYGFGGPDVLACATVFGVDTLKYNVQI